MKPCGIVRRARQRPGNVAVAAFALSLSCIATAQDYPRKPVRIVTSEPGSALDLTARIIALGLTSSFGQQFVVDNRRVLTVELVAKATPDGYTLLVYGGPLWITPLLRKDVTYDPVKDFVPITLAITTPSVLVVHPRIAAKSVQELIALARTKPGQLNYASSVSGGLPHLAGELFNSLADISLTRIAYKGVAQGVNDLIGGQVDVMFPVVATGMPHAKAGRVRALAVTSAQPWSLAPGLPTMAAAGLPGYELIAMYGMLAPTKTPPAILARLHRETVQHLNQPEIRQKILASGLDVLASTPQQYAAAMAADMARMSKLIRDRNIRDE